jgi:hypothetical protein
MVRVVRVANPRGLRRFSARKMELNMHRYCVIACTVIGGYCAAMAPILIYTTRAGVDSFVMASLPLAASALAFGLAAIATKDSKENSN